MDVLVSDLECDSYSETSESEDQNDNESTYGGRAQSILSSLDESIEKIDDILAYERGFVHGDIVCSITDPSGQLGRVVDVDMIVDLETTYGELIKEVNSKKLLSLRSFAPGDYVVHGPWLGRVDRVLDVVTILFDDGTTSKIVSGDPEILVPVPPFLFEDAPYPYYPSQRVKVKLPTISKSVRWLCGPSKTSQNEGTICHVEVGSVHVNWITSIMIGWGVTPSTPAHIQNPADLTLLSCFPHANWQIGEWCTLLSDNFHGFHMEKKFGMNDQCHRQMYVIAKTKTKVDVVWQDGRRSLGLDSQTLLPVSSVGDHDFWHGQFVLEKDINLPSGRKWGIVRSVDAQERIVKVKWYAPENLVSDGFIEEPNEDIVSAYELIEHPDFSYCIGDVVFRLLPPFESSVLFGSNTLLKKNIGESIAGQVSGYLSCIGNVIGFTDEAIEVRWASDLISKVHPSEIFGLDKLDHPPSVPAVNEEIGSETVNREMVDKEKQPCLKKDASALLFPWEAIGYLTSVATNLFNSLGSTSFSDPWKEDSELQTLKAENSQLGVDDSGPDSLKQQVEETELDEQPPFSPGMSTLKFKRFDIVSNCSDHQFMKCSNEALASSQVKRGWMKKVQQEWSILKKDLPDSIFVRVYEERIDLLRACIVGASGTPYHDGLFFFDIFFPPDYPQEPPLVHYHSGGLRLNPNLYESGKVCLSLLKTWTGTGTEVWSPESSTILQVLLSLQALVLNDKPYFNEAGYDDQIGRAEGEKNSVTYNENAFLLSCKSMLYILHKPPKHFEALVEEHFTHRSHHILLACKAYVDGAKVGCTFEHGKSCSTGFKIMLAKLFPKMIAGFSDRGIDCTQFHGQLNQFPGTG